MFLGTGSNARVASQKNVLSFLRSRSKALPFLGLVVADGFLVGWFKTAKHRFGLHRFGQNSLLGVYRWLVLLMLAFLVTHWAYLLMSTDTLPDWGHAAQLALSTFFSQLVVLLLLLEIERLQPLLQRQGIELHFSRCKI
jgi:hypothetical protein